MTYDVQCSRCLRLSSCACEGQVQHSFNCYAAEDSVAKVLVCQVG